MICRCHGPAGGWEKIGCPPPPPAVTPRSLTRHRRSQSGRWPLWGSCPLLGKVWDGPWGTPAAVGRGCTHRCCGERPTLALAPEGIPPSTPHPPTPTLTKHPQSSMPFHSIINSPATRMKTHEHRSTCITEHLHLHTVALLQYSSH